MDDEPDMCWALERIMKKNGVLSKKASSGREALALVGSSRFRLALLDAKLPDMDGLVLAGKIRKFDPSIRIIMISGYFYKNDVAIQRALSEGLIHGFVSKPFNNSEILKIIEITCPA